MQNRSPIFRGIMAALCAVVMVACVYVHYRVEGSEIEGVPDMDETCTVTVERYSHLDYENRETVVLEPAEAETLKELLLNSVFVQRFGRGGTVRYSSDTMYDIAIDFKDGQTYISIHVIGNEYLSVLNQYGHMKIKDETFQQKLEGILSDAGI